MQKFLKHLKKHVGNGIEDSIEYEYHEITDKLNEYILEQNQIVEKEEQIVEIIESVLEKFI